MSLYERAVNVLARIYARGIRSGAVLDSDTYFPGARDFQSNWRDWRAESDQIVQNLERVPRFHEVMPSQADISANDNRDWRMFILQAYGVPVPGNLARCPKLAAMIAAHPEVLSATLSFLASGKHIPEHHGPFRGIVRYYLVLRVPLTQAGEPGAILRIDGIDHRVGEGGDLLWDDTFRHEVWNQTEEVRVALLLDVRRAHLPAPLRVLTKALVAAIATGFRWRLATGRDITIG